MLSPSDLLLIVGTTAACTGIVTVVTFIVLYLNRRRSVVSQFAVVVVAAIVSIVCSTVAIAAEMYFSQHDLHVLFWVIGVSAVMSLVASLLTAFVARRSIVALRDSARRVGQGDVVDADTGGWKELTEVSAQLADASERLAAARAEVAELDAARSQFFAWISHDLRTPLTGMRALAEALEAGVAADPTDYTRRIRTQVDTMNRLVDDLFELSKLHSGTLRLRLESVDLLDVVSDAVADVQPLAAVRSIRIAQAGVDGHMLYADPHELTRVIHNLLTNGIRHAPDGSEILVSAQRSDADRLVLSVLDQGSGVDTEDLGRMFEVGWRAGSARTPGGGVGAAGAGAGADGAGTGAGLGLAIVRGIVEAHGGDVLAENVPTGFRLSISLPTLAP
ncbi:sensor histidine kinase [Plantibacter sp. Mn2098]|uniref:sensor histidine kinase n=1 Tax=Plantibacter sp. Mn2098 TaxID=3395266 RepID=UPI003BCA3BDF